MRFVKKPAPPPVPGNVVNGVSKDAVLSKYPALAEYLTACTWEDGKPRQTSTLVLFVEEGAWKCCFNDRDGQRVAFVTDPTFTGLLGALEAGLSEEGLDWRPSKPWRRGKQ